MRIITMLAAALLAGGLLAGPAGAATVAAPAPAPVGGAALGSPGVTVGAGAPGLPGDLSAASWLVADVGTGAVLAAKDPHGRYEPASTIKTLTAVTLIPRLDPQARYTVTNDDVDVDGSKVGLVPGLTYSVHQLFTAMLVVSGNDAARAVASAAGGQARTVALMNAEAQRLRALDTTVRDVSGLDAPGQATSSYDLALISRAGLTMPDFRSYVATIRSTMPAPGGHSFAIYTHNKLLANHVPGAIGVKNGYTVAARASFVGAATRGGHTILVTLMRADPDVWREADELLEWGFRAEAAGTARVGRLVDPPRDQRPVADVTTQDGRTRGSAVRAAQQVEGAASPWGEVSRPLAGALVLVLAGLTGLRWRAVRRRRYRRLKLPRL